MFIYIYIIYITNNSTWTAGQEGHTSQIPKSLASTTPLGIQRMRPYSCLHCANAPPLAVLHMCSAGVRNKEGQESHVEGHSTRALSGDPQTLPGPGCQSPSAVLGSTIWTRTSKESENFHLCHYFSKCGLRLIGVPDNEWQGCCGALSS